MVRRGNPRGWGGLGGVCALLIFFCIAGVRHSKALGAVKGEHLHLELLPGTGTIRGFFQFNVRNNSKTKMGRQEFFLYPEMFSLDFLTHNFNDFIDGREIRPGEFRVLAVERVDGGKVIPRDEEGPFFSILLTPPIEPGMETTVRLFYEIVVPNHYSCFSSVRGNMYLNGAMYPLPVDYEEGRRVIGLDGGMMEVETSQSGAEDGRTLIVPNSFGYITRRGVNGEGRLLADVREVGIFLADYREFRFEGGETGPTFFFEKISRRQRKKIEVTIKAVGAFLRSRHPELLEELNDLIIIEAPLRKRVSFFTPYGVIVSDRIFESIKVFQTQHEESLIESLFSHLASTRAKGSRVLSKVYAEFVAKILTDEFREYTEMKIKNLRKTIKPVTFIPTFGRIYYDKDLPFARSYISTVYRFGIPGEDFPSPEYGRITGDSIYRVVKSYTPDLDPAHVQREYFRGRDLLAILARWGLDQDFADLQRKDKRNDYRVRSILKSNGRNEITLENTNENAPREVVRVLIDMDDGTRRDLKWDTREREVTLVVETLPEIGVKNVIIDPDLVMEDTDRSNNFLKKPTRVTLHSTRFSYEFNTGDISASALINFKKAYDERNSYFLNLQTGDTSSSVRFDYRRALRVRPVGGLFGQAGLQYSRQRNLIPSEENVVDGIIALDYSSPEYPFYPAGDIRAFASFASSFYGRNGSKKFYTAIGRVVKYFPLDLKNTIATKLDGGVVWGDVFRDRLLDLGGRSRIRGIKSGDVRVENLLVGTVEFRHMVTIDLNLELPLGLYALHGLSTHLFFDGGTGENPSLPPGEKEGIRGSAGLGLFLFGNFLGIAPVELNFELARELDRFLDATTLFYFSFNQNF